MRLGEWSRQAGRAFHSVGVAVVNLKTAKALGIEIPKAVMFRVDRVIQ